MPKTYSNRKLVGASTIKSTYNNINLNSDEIETDLTTLFAQDVVLSDQLTEIINETDLDPNKDPEVTNARNSSEFGSFPTVKDRLDNTDVIVGGLTTASVTPELTNLASIFNVGEGTEGTYVTEDSFVTDEGYEGLSLVNSISGGDVTTDVTSDGGSTLIGIKIDGTNYFENNFSTSEQVLNIISGAKYFAIYQTLPSSIGNLKDYINIKYSDGTLIL